MAGCFHPLANGLPSFHSNSNLCSGIGSLKEMKEACLRELQVSILRDIWFVASKG
jgi:hypothetical protein